MSRGKVEGMRIKLRYLSTIETKEKVFKRIKTIGVENEDIEAVAQYHNKDGKLERNKCYISHKTFGNMVIYKTFEDMYNIWTDTPFEVRGFKYNKTRRKK